MMRDRQIESVGIGVVVLGMVAGLAMAGMATDDYSRFQGEQQEAFMGLGNKRAECQAVRAGARVEDR